jgi:hypothetical protein
VKYTTAITIPANTNNVITRANENEEFGAVDCGAALMTKAFEK